MTRLRTIAGAACALLLAQGLEAGYAPGCSVRLDLGAGPVHEAREIVIQPDGRIVVAGYVDLGLGKGKDFIVARFHPDLSLDTSFNGVGYVVTDFFGKDDEADAVVLQTNGKIVVGGYAYDATGTLKYLALARYLPNGTLDSPFGVVTHDVPGNAEELRALALQPDGKIVGVGSHSASGTDLIVVRFQSDGSWDSLFDGDGVLMPAIGDDSLGTGVAVTANGNIVVSGTGIFSGNADFIALRVLPDGILDGSFNGTGWVSTDLGFADYANGGLAVDNGNNIIIAGDSNFDIALVRYRANGSLDPTFGTGGIQFHNAGGNDVGQAVALDPLGIIVAGYAGPGVNFALTRFNAGNGANNLSITTSFSGLQNAARAMAIRDDGKYVLAGYSQVASVNQLTLALFNTDGSQDCSSLSLHPQTSTVSGFARLGCTQNWDCVNDQAGNALIGAPAANDGGTSYVVSTLPVTQDLYRLVDGALPGGKFVTEIEVVGELRWDGTGGLPSVDLLYQRAGLDPVPVHGATLVVSNTSFATFRHTFGSLNWDSSDLDALEIGLEHEAGGGLRLTQLYVNVTLGECRVQPVSTLAASATGTGSSGQVTLNWLNPSYGAYAETVIRRDTIGCPSSPTAGVAVVNQSDGLGNVGGFVDTPPIGTYYYGAFVEDAEDHPSTGECVRTTTFDRMSKQVDWVYSTSDPSPALATPGLRAAAGVVYAVTNDGLVHAMTAGSAGAGGGSWPPGWKPIRLGGNAPNRPPIVLLPSGTWAALFGAEDGRVYAVDASSGALIWRSARLGAMLSSSPGAILSQFGGLQDLVFIGTRNTSGPNSFFALNAKDGTVAWSYDPGPGPNSMGIVTSSPSVDYTNQRVYFTSYLGASGDTMWCIDFSGGGPAQCGAWPGYGVPISGSDIETSPISLSGFFYVTDTAPGSLYAVNPTDGSALGLSLVGTGGAMGYVFPRYGTTDVIVSSSSDVQSFDTTPPGFQNWSYPVNAPSTPLQVPGTDDIYVGGGDGQLHRLSTLAPGGPGTTECIGNCSSTTVGSPTFDLFHQMIYVGTIDGEVYAVKTPF